MRKFDRTDAKVASAILILALAMPFIIAGLFAVFAP